MAESIVWSSIYLGNFADMDTDEGTNWVEDPSALLTTFGDGPVEVLAQDIVDIHTWGGGDNVVDTNNGGPVDQIQYDLGDGAGLETYAIDSAVVFHGIVTFADGSTFESDFGTFQTTSGDVFMIVLDTQPELVSQGIDSITFTSVVTSDFGAVDQFNKDNLQFVCFGPGTRIDTPLGPKRIDRLKPGDFVSTLDDGPQPIRWIGKRRLHFDSPDPGQPVVIARGAFGPGLPRRPLMISPNHRLLVATSPAFALHDPLGALAPAKALTRQPGIPVARGRRAITYFTLLLPIHAVIVAEGLAAESLYPGPQSWAALTGPERSDWLRLAAHARVTGVPPARLLLSAAEARAGLESGAIALPGTPPRILPWSARRRRCRTQPMHLPAR